MAAITWRNLTGTNSPAAVTGIGQAATTMNQGVNILDKLLQRGRTAADERLAMEQEAQQQGYMNLLDGAKTVEGLEQLRTSGQLDQAFAALPPEIQAKVRAADEARRTSLMDEVTKGQQYGLEQARFQALPGIDQINQLLANNQPEQAEALLANLPEGQRGAAAKSIQQARLDAQKREEQEKDRKHLLDLRPGQVEKAKLELEQARRTAVDQERAGVEAETMRGLTTRLATEAGTHQAGMQQLRTTATEVIKRFAPDLPMNEDGSLKTHRFTSAQRQAVDAHLASQGLPKLAQVYELGDTDAASTFIGKLKKEGYRPDQIAAMEAQIPAAFSTAPKAEIGIDAATGARDSTAAEAQAKHLEERYGRVATQESEGELSDVGKEAIESITPDDPGKRADLKEMLNQFILKGGIKVGDQRILPSPQKLKAMIGSINQRWWVGHTTEFNDVFETWMNDPDMQTGAEEILKGNYRKVGKELDAVPTDDTKASFKRKLNK